jgi:hypothetical protein
MDIYFATFNCTKPDLAKAKRAFGRKFGAGSFKTWIQPYLDKGIMSIFKDSPNKYTKFYVETLARYVNERLNEPEVETEPKSDFQI